MAGTVQEEHLLVLLARVIRGRRLEVGVTLVAYAARVLLTHAVSLQVSKIILLVAGIVFAASARTQQWLVRVAREHKRDRFLRSGFAFAGITKGSIAMSRPIINTETGFSTVIRVPRGLTGEDLYNSSERFAAAFAARAVRVKRDPDNASRAEITISYRSAFVGTGVDWPAITSERMSLWQAIPLGVAEDGSVVTVTLPERNVLVGGEPGGGKSNALSLIVSAAALDPSSDLWLFDPKLVELSQWKPIARRFVGADLNDAIEALRELRAEMERRYELLVQQRLRKVTQASGIRLALVVVDELALYVSGRDKARDEVSDLLRDLVARGRAAGIIVITATQKPSSDVVPTSLRDLLGFRLALRCSTKEASDTVLGSGWASLGYSASEVDPTARGVGWLLAEGGLPVMLRCFRLDDEAITAILNQAMALRAVPR